MALRAEYARKLLEAEKAYANARQVVAIAERERNRQRARCRSSIEDGKLTIAGGVQITVTPTSTGLSFRLAEFLKAHKISKSMAPFVGDATTYDRWTVKEVAP